MDNLRRRTFLYLDDIVNATPFYKPTDVAGKKIVRLYIPNLPDRFNYCNSSTSSSTINIMKSTSSNFLYNASKYVCKSDGSLLTTTSQNYRWYGGCLIDASSPSNVIIGRNLLHLRTTVYMSVDSSSNTLFKTILPYLGSSSYDRMYLSNPSATNALDMYKTKLFELFGMTDIPYLCIDFSKFYITSSSNNGNISNAKCIGAYLQIKDLSEYQNSTGANENFFYSPFDELYPYYYEEYQES